METYQAWYLHLTQHSLWSHSWSGVGKGHPPLLALAWEHKKEGDLHTTWPLDPTNYNQAVDATQEQGVYVSETVVHVSGASKLAQWVLTQVLGLNCSAYMEESREVLLSPCCQRFSSDAAQQIG